MPLSRWWECVLSATWLTLGTCKARLRFAGTDPPGKLGALADTWNTCNRVVSASWSLLYMPLHLSSEVTSKKTLARFRLGSFPSFSSQKAAFFSPFWWTVIPAHLKVQ